MNEDFNNPNTEKNKDNSSNNITSIDEKNVNNNIQLSIKATHKEKRIGVVLILLLYSFPILAIIGCLPNIPYLFFIHMGLVIIATCFIVYIHKKGKRDMASTMIFCISPIYIYYLLFGSCMFMMGL